MSSPVPRTPEALVSIRHARAADADTVATFNMAMAFETEGKRLLPAVVGAGVRRLLAEPGLGFYLVAEKAGENGGAQATYRRLGMQKTDYLLMEQLRAGVVYLRPD